MDFGVSKLKPILRALESRNYRLFFAGQAISLVGTWMTQIATVWLVYDLTNSALWLGTVGFSSQIPSFLISPFGGIIVDRWNRHRILITTQILAMIQSLALAALALSGVIQIWHIILLSLFQGLITAVDSPARQAFVPEIIERKENLGNAIALNSSVFNGARLVGPAIAGLLIASVGTGVCFLMDGLSYIAVVAGLLAMKLKPRKIVTQTTNVWQRLIEGFSYAFGFPPIRAILLLLALFSFMGMPYTILIPIFAKNILQGSAETLGFLMAAVGVGALVGGVYLSSRSTVIGLGKIIAIAPAIFGTGLVIFSQSRILWLSLFMMFLVGFGGILQIASSNTILQTIVEDDKRGRLMSLYTMSFLGILPFGNLASGALADKIGAPDTLMIGGFCCILGSLAFTKQLPKLRRLIRPIYVEIGLLDKASS
ncbi:MFS transporter [Microcoleus sp. FACHB-SPT15]|uniref:MFS transporter n=1 Tax=Microcoleus sp. FACHB-SPT15 TaxID=2692830 RepID=UPI00177C2A3A|nr:MFS transporter [Microcoleus sp. FACHB-SPT15]MBD1807557.1 MFS transporter [Microcoleus sp. FACHB-SPT15]